MHNTACLVDCTTGTPIQFQTLNHPKGSCLPAPLSSLAPTELTSVPEPLLFRFLWMKLPCLWPCFLSMDNVRVSLGPCGCPLCTPLTIDSSCWHHQDEPCSES